MNDAGPTNTELRLLIDKQAIGELVFTYSRAVDRRDFTLLRSLYTEDGYDDHGGLFRGPADAYVDWLKQAIVGNDITAHAVHNHLIEFSGPDTAEGEVYVTAYHRIQDPEDGLIDLIMGMRYLDQYQRDNQGWRFSRRQVVNDWCQRAPACWDTRQPWLQGTPVGTGDAADPSYSTLGLGVFSRR